MFHFHDRTSINRALSMGLRPSLHRLLAERVAALGEDLIDWTEYLVVEPGDTNQQIVRAIGLSPLREPFYDIRYGEPGFWPHWNWLAEHDGWFELIFTFGSTFAYVVLIADEPGVDPDLLAMCREYAST